MDECGGDGSVLQSFQDIPDMLDFIPGELWALNVGAPFWSSLDEPMPNTDQLSGASLGASSTAAGTPDPKTTADIWRQATSGQSTNSWEQSSSPEETEVDPRRLKRQVQNRIASVVTQSWSDVANISHSQRAHRAKQRAKMSELDTKIQLVEDRCKQLYERNQKLETALRRLVNDASMLLATSEDDVLAEYSL